MSGYAKLAHYHADLMVSVATSVVEQLSDLSDLHLTNLLYSYAILNVDASAMFSSVVKELKTRLAAAPELTGQQLVLQLWSCAVTDVLDRDLWDALMGQINPEELGPESLSQVFQSLMLCIARYSQKEWPIEKTMLEESEKAWRSQVSEIKTSLFHREVSRTLNAMKITHTLEHLTDDGLFSGTFLITLFNLWLKINSKSPSPMVSALQSQLHHSLKPSLSLSLILNSFSL